MDTWPLYSDPLAVSLILAAYALVLHQGTKFMKNRNSFNLKYLILLYNLVQVGYNFWLLQLSTFEPLFWKNLFSFGCAQMTSQEEQNYKISICRACWHMTILKIMDLLDTVFFILCKKQSNVTFLHVQHHILSVAILWVCGKYFMGQEFTVTFFCNIIVHVIMYFYYFLAALGPAYKKYLWWKKYLTTIQIIQFVIIILYMIASFWLSCGYNQKLIWLLICNVSLNLVLFLNFYFHAYDSKKMIRDKMAVCGSLQFTNSYTENNQCESSDKNDNYKKVN